MRVPFPLCRSSSSDHRGFLDIRKDRTVGGICRKCQPPSQQIVHDKARYKIEGWLSLYSELRVLCSPVSERRGGGGRRGCRPGGGGISSRGGGRRVRGLAGRDDRLPRGCHRDDRLRREAARG